MCVYVWARGVGRREMGGVVGVWVRGSGRAGKEVEVEGEAIVVGGEERDGRGLTATGSLARLSPGKAALAQTLYRTPDADDLEGSWKRIIQL